jgi:hypothetical protein
VTEHEKACPINNTPDYKNRKHDQTDDLSEQRNFPFHFYLLNFSSSVETPSLR